LAYYPGSNVYHLAYTNPSAGRIATFSTPSFATTYVATHSANTIAAQQIDAYFGQSGLLTKVDWLNLDPYSAINPAIDWISDPFVNIAWTADDVLFTDKQDIIVAQHDLNGVDLFPGDWSRANIITPNQQHVVSISGLEFGRENLNDVFGYCWVDNDRFIRYKYNGASVQALRYAGNPTSFEILPAPSSDEIYLRSIDETTLQSVVVFDLQGRRIASFGSEESQLTIQTQSWPTGVYLIVVNDGKPERFLKY
jgi:hypothetical protein